MRRPTAAARLPGGTRRSSPPACRGPERATDPRPDGFAPGRSRRASRPPRGPDRPAPAPRRRPACPRPPRRPESRRAPGPRSHPAPIARGPRHRSIGRSPARCAAVAAAAAPRRAGLVRGRCRAGSPCCSKATRGPAAPRCGRASAGTTAPRRRRTPPPPPCSPGGGRARRPLPDALPRDGSAGRRARPCWPRHR